MYPDGHVLSNFLWFFGRGEANGRTTNDGVESHRSKFSQVQPAQSTGNLHIFLCAAFESLLLLCLQLFLTGVEQSVPFCSRAMDTGLALGG